MGVCARDVGRGAVFRRGVKEEEGEREGRGGVGVEAEERASAASLLAHMQSKSK
jgi:hypothetical protein